MTEARRHHWEKVYTEKDAKEVSWYQLRPELSLELISQTGAAKKDALIDIGGGASTLVDCLVEAGYSDLSVLDIAEQALKTARQRLGESAGKVDWIQSDITEFSPERQYRVWHDRAVFHFLTEAADREAYLTALISGLQPGGHLVIAAFALDGPEMCSGLPVRRYDANLMSETLGERFRLLETRDELHQTPAAKQQQFCFYLYEFTG
jgi:2-polyprenyl-3-methyl-5-hydroxy-6-metoxy-1,4-benzoquinol methylase